MGDQRYLLYPILLAFFVAHDCTPLYSQSGSVHMIVRWSQKLQAFVALIAEISEEKTLSLSQAHYHSKKRASWGHVAPSGKKVGTCDWQQILTSLLGTGFQRKTVLMQKGKVLIDIALMFATMVSLITKYYILFLILNLK